METIVSFRGVREKWLTTSNIYLLQSLSRKHAGRRPKREALISELVLENHGKNGPPLVREKTLLKRKVKEKEKIRD